MHYYGVLKAEAADILDPSIYKKMKRLYFFSQSKIHLTAGSYCNMALYQPAEVRANTIVFLGRFEIMKQVLPFTKAIPSIVKALTDLNKQFDFVLLGKGNQEEELRELLATPAYKELPIQIQFTTSPEQYLNKASIFVSLQLHNNYPSRSLLEAMAAGCIPLVTNTGDTALIAPPHIATYVPEYFSTQDIVHAIVNIVNQKDADIMKKRIAARQHVAQNFTLERMATYYLDLYKSVSNK